MPCFQGIRAELSFNLQKMMQNLAIPIFTSPAQADVMGKVLIQIPFSTNSDGFKLAISATKVGTLCCGGQALACEDGVRRELTDELTPEYKSNFNFTDPQISVTDFALTVRFGFAGEDTGLSITGSLNLAVNAEDYYYKPPEEFLPKGVASMSDLHCSEGNATDYSCPGYWIAQDAIAQSIATKHWLPFEAALRISFTPSLSLTLLIVMDGTWAGAPTQSLSFKTKAS